MSALLEVGWMQMHISNYFKINLNMKQKSKSKQVEEKKMLRRRVTSI